MLVECFNSDNRAASPSSVGVMHQLTISEISQEVVQIFNYRLVQRLDAREQETILEALRYGSIVSWPEA